MKDPFGVFLIPAFNRENVVHVTFFVHVTLKLFFLTDRTSREILQSNGLTQDVIRTSLHSNTPSVIAIISQAMAS